MVAVGRGEQLVRVVQAISKADVTLDWGLPVAYELEEDAVREGQTLTVSKLAKAIEEELQKRGSKGAAASAVAGGASSKVGGGKNPVQCYFCSGDHRSDACSMNTGPWGWLHVKSWYAKGYRGLDLVNKLKEDDIHRKQLQQGYQGYTRQAYGAPQPQYMAAYPHWVPPQQYQGFPPQPAPPQGQLQWKP